MANIVPATSVEFQTLTTEPAYGDTDEVDMDVNNNKDKNGGKIELPEPDYWKLMSFYTRDLRLGNISHKVYDVEYLEDMLGLTQSLLNVRGGRFKQLSFLALNRVASALEISHNVGGFFRKNAQSIHQTGDTTLRETKQGGFNPLKRRGGM